MAGGFSEGKEKQKGNHDSGTFPAMGNFRKKKKVGPKGLPQLRARYAGTPKHVFGRSTLRSI